MGAVEGEEALGSFVELDEFKDSDKDEPEPTEEKLEESDKPPLTEG